MPKPKTGEVWLVRFPFTDLTTSKLRPAFVLTSHGEDVIVMGIFSRVPPAWRATWVSIDERHAAFAQTGLKKSFVLKAEKIAVIHESIDRKPAIGLVSAGPSGPQECLAGHMMTLPYCDLRFLILFLPS